MNILKDTALSLTLTPERIVQLINSDIVQLINGDNTDGGAAKIAGAYAFDFALANEFLNAESLSNGLKYLKDKGAEFNFDAALKIAIAWSFEWAWDWDQAAREDD